MQVDAEIKQIFDAAKAVSALIKDSEEEYSPNIEHGNVLESYRGWHQTSEWADKTHVAIIQDAHYLDFGYIKTYSHNEGAGALHHLRYCKKNMRMVSRAELDATEILAYLPLYVAKDLIHWRTLNVACRLNLGALLEKRFNLNLEFLKK